MPANGPKRRLAVLGGGLAALTTAYELASRSDEFEITVYQMGWRLGGKLASSRNADRGMRIEEHGIHVLFGAYENAFHVLRRVYGDLGCNWRNAFVERDNFTLMEHVGRRWEPWTMGLPRSPGDPGDSLGDPAGNRKEFPRLTSDVIAWLRDRVLEYFAGTLLEIPAQWFFGATLGRAHGTAHAMCEQALGGDDAKAEARRLLWHLRLNLFLLRVVSGIGHALWTVLRLVLGRNALVRVDGLRRLWILAETAVAVAAGLTRAALDEKAVQDLDDLDLTQWLRRNGVLGCGLSRTSADSAALRMVYEVVFAYEGGDARRRKLAAGTATRDLLRLVFDRHGALAYSMPAGSAETIITPLYRVLLAKGVRFEFFHRVDGLELSADGRTIERIHFTRQAQVKSAYDPLLEGGGWPSHPKYEQLVDGDRLQESEREDGGRNLEMPGFTPPTASAGTLERRASDAGDFDDVVLAIPVEALRTICAPLAERDERWRNMLHHLKTTPTHSVQLWLDRTAAEIGWRPPGTETAVLLGAYAQPFGNWADLSITLATEQWQRLGFLAPRSVAYLCGPLDERTIAAGGLCAQQAQVRATCADWLARHGRTLWPGVFDGGGLDQARFVAAASVAATDRYGDQMFRANVNPSDRYTLSLPGTTRFRLAPDESGFTGLYLAGDWTANGFDVGSVEATVMSGRIAARALLGLDAAAMPVYGEDHEHLGLARLARRRREAAARTTR